MDGIKSHLRGCKLQRILKIPQRRLAGYGAAGFFAAGCCLENRAPLAAGLVAACKPGRNGMAALLGGLLGGLLFFPFGPALRCGGILVLIYAVLTAFQDTKWFRQGWFRPLTAAGATMAVELAYFQDSKCVC